jgi:hypothetical protein
MIYSRNERLCCDRTLIGRGVNASAAGMLNSNIALTMISGSQNNMGITLLALLAVIVWRQS